MISVIIPLYNKEKQIVETLQSVLNQTFHDFEIVVVNDGSTDSSIAEVEIIQDPRIRLIHQQNTGVSAARNRGIYEAKGEYIAFLDADDKWNPEYLETQKKLIDKYPECNVFATNYVFQNIDKVEKQTSINHLKFEGEDGTLENYFQVAANSTPPLWTSAVVVSKEAIESVGGFPVGIKSGEDLLTWARLACRYKIAFSRRPLAVFFFDESAFNADQISRDVSRDDEVGKGLKELYAKYDKPFIREYIALWYKMRTRITLSKHRRKMALHECMSSIKYDLNIKILIFLTMCFLPYRLTDSLFKRLG